jgi:hypothetical protein
MKPGPIHVRRSAQDLVIALSHLTEPETDCMLLAGSALRDGRKVIGFGNVIDHELELVLEDGQPPYVGTNLSPVGAPPPLTLRELLAHVDSSGAQRLTVITRTGDRRPVLGAVPLTTNTGAGNGRWQVLVTTRSIS